MAPDIGKPEPKHGAAPHKDTDAPADTSKKTTTSLSPATAPSSLCRTTSSPHQSVTDLYVATPGTAGLDISTNNTVKLSDCSDFCPPTGLYGHLKPGNHILVIGRSSTSITGLFVLPGVIDSDSVGEIMIMAWIPPATLCSPGREQYSPTHACPGSTPICTPDS